MGKEHEPMFVDDPSAENKYFGEMISVLQKFNCPDKHIKDFMGTPSYADPFLISYAKETNSIIVTHEKKANNQFQGRVKIPDMCSELGVRCIDLKELFHEVKANFVLQADASI